MQDQFHAQQDKIKRAEERSGIPGYYQAKVDLELINADIQKLDLAIDEQLTIAKNLDETTEIKRANLAKSIEKLATLKDEYSSLESAYHRKKHANNSKMKANEL